MAKKRARRNRGERRTLFYKYAPPSVAWCATYYQPDGLPTLTDIMAELEALRNKGRLQRDPAEGRYSLTD